MKHGWQHILDNWADCHPEDVITDAEIWLESDGLCMCCGISMDY